MSRSLGALAAAWFVAVELFACGLGGCWPGARTRWASVHDDEVYFRDTAHGLSVWRSQRCSPRPCLRLRSVGGQRRGASRRRTQHRRRPQRAKAHPSPTRPTTSHPPIGDRTPTATETRRILTRALVSGELPDQQDLSCDGSYQSDGNEFGDSEKRWTDVFAQAKGARDEAATKAKEAGADQDWRLCSAWAFVSLLVAAIGELYGDRRRADARGGEVGGRRLGYGR